uniref:XK-related protein n=1 Tax=Pipistrellus kuhlii TaxID=59472 RepID=A0A7J8ADP4_PIPKU|nr:XK related 8 [Pipistrellus kuhlii]
MPCSLRAILLRDLVLGVLGVSAFLVHLGADLWAVSQYVLSGCYLWAALVLSLLGVASVALQVFSWIWLRADPAGLHAAPRSVRCLALLHLLQLGFLYRCLQGLQQGLLVWQQETPSQFDLAYADFLSLDISMLRLFETFLERTPQLTLVLAIVLQSGRAEYYQCEGWHLHGLPGHLLGPARLPPGPAHLPPRQARPGAGLLRDLLPVEPAAAVAPRPGRGPLLGALPPLRGSALPGPVAGAAVLGLVAGHRFHARPPLRVALPGHSGHHPLLLLVQRGRGPHSRPRHHPPGVPPERQRAHGGHLGDAGRLAARRGPAAGAAALGRPQLPSGSGAAACLLPLAAPQLPLGA